MRKKCSYPLLGLTHCFASKRQVDINHKSEKIPLQPAQWTQQRMFSLKKVSDGWHSNKIAKKSLTTLEVAAQYHNTTVKISR